MKLAVLAFASAREAIGAGRIELELAGASTTVAELGHELRRRYPALEPLWPRLALAVDGTLAGSETPVGDGAEVALLPPVSGGASEAVSLVRGELELSALLAAVADPAHGATLVFLGRVRDHRRDRAVTHLSYQAYEPMALAAMRRIVAEIEVSRACRVALSHRLGEAGVGQATVAIAVSAPHRDEAYAANREALERLKREVPIWKREHYADGDAAWLEVEALSPSRA